MPIDTTERGLCVAVLEDAKLIVSVHLDATVRRWDAHTGEVVGGSIYNHPESANSMAVRGNLIVSSSTEGFLYRCTAITGEVIGNALQRLEYRVSSVLVSAESKLIVFGS